MKRTVFHPRELAAIKSLTTVLDFQSIVWRLVAALDFACASKPYQISIVYGTRSSAEQWALYAEGRVKDDAGHWQLIPGQRTFTNSTPEKSAHCFRAAVDIALVSDDDLRWLEGDDPAWDRMASEVRKRGLTTGRDWHRTYGPYGDAAHVELTDWQRLVTEGHLEQTP